MTKKGRGGIKKKPTKQKRKTEKRKRWLFCPWCRMWWLLYPWSKCDDSWVIFCDFRNKLRILSSRYCYILSIKTAKHFVINIDTNVLSPSQVELSRSQRWAVRPHLRPGVWSCCTPTRSSGKPSVSSPDCHGRQYKVLLKNKFTLVPFISPIFFPVLCTFW